MGSNPGKCENRLRFNISDELVDSQSYPSDSSIISRVRRSQTATPRPIDRTGEDSPFPNIPTQSPNYQLRQSPSLPQWTNFAMLTSSEEDRRYFSMLGRTFPNANAMQMETISLKASTQQPALPPKQDDVIQGGRIRQLSDPSSIFEPKRPKLRSSRARSVRDLITRPGSSLGKASARDAPPLPSKNVQEATLSASLQSPPGDTI